MANKKFSEFELKTTTSNVSHIVGYNGAENVRITPANFLDTTGGPYLPLAGGLMVGNTTHNDNVKSIYGTANDGLEIFHDGSNSIIADNGTGNLILRAATSFVAQGINQSNLIIANQGGGVNLYYNNVNKFDTNNTGINVTGGVTVNDTLNSVLELNTSNANCDITMQSVNTSSLTRLRNATNDFQVHTNGTLGLTIDSSQNATFAGDVFAINSGDVTLQARESVTGNLVQLYQQAGNSYLIAGKISGTPTQSLLFYTGGAEKMRLDASGNLGVGGTNAAAYGKFLVEGTGNLINANATSGAATFQLYEQGAGRFGIVTLDGTAGAKFTLAGVEKMRLDALGNLGLGTSTPNGGKLHVEFDTSTVYDGTANQAGGLFVNNLYHEALNTFSQIRLGVSGGSGASAVRLVAIEPGQARSDFAVVLRDGSNFGEKLRIVGENGNVGIGTSTPTSKVSINDPGTGLSFSNAASGNFNIGLLAGTGTADAYVYQRANANMILGTNNTERIRITSGGNVGIKNTSPGASLEVNAVGGGIGGYTGFKLKYGTASVLSYYVGQVTAGNGVFTGTGQYRNSGQWQTEGTAASTITYNAGGEITFFTDAGLTANTDYNQTERMRLTSAGALLVGRTSSLTGVHTIQADEGGGGSAVLTVYNQNLSNSSPAINTIKNSSTTTSDARFVQFYADGGTVPMGGIVGNGASNVQFAAISDIREKENIKSISGSLDKISKLNPVEFDWKKSGEHIKAGFIAQEVEEIFPEYVVENISNEGEEERKGLTGGMTSGIVPHLVKAIQELKAEIELLKNK